MPMRIRDSQIRAFTEATERNTTQPKLTDAAVVDLLAAVGDRWLNGADGLKQQLSRPDITRRQQFDIANRGMSGDEKADLGELLDNSGWQMDAGAKNFLEALAGRAPLKETLAPLTFGVTGDQRNGIVGTAKAGEVIEAINLSTAPSGRLHLTDTVELGRADATGKFSGTLPDMKEGDLIRMRTRAADGSTSDWLTIQARGIEGSDTRNAQVNLERMDLAVGTDGISVTHNTDRPISEPNAQVRFTNVRTGEHTVATINDAGSLPAGFKLPGQAGDEFKVAVTDRKNNVDFATVAGSLRVAGAGGNTGGVSLPDPDALAKDKRPDGTTNHSLTRFSGPLFIDGPKADDVRQGAIGDCYFPAAMASLAFWKPEAIRDAIKDNGDGTYTVKFHDNGGYGGSGRPVEIKVDGDLYARAWGGPAYGSSLGGSTEPDKMELWFPLIEKAYAQWKGSYETIGSGGVAGKVMGEVLGKGYDYVNLSAGNKDSVFDQIKAAAAQGRPMAAGTYGTDQADRYTNTGVYANHAYSVLGTEEENGVKYVKLRNPWGQSEYGHDGKNDGFFRIELDKFAELYRAVHIIEA
jgi:Calpain family cysteine protease